jgi:hypothetical protein
MSGYRHWVVEEGDSDFEWVARCACGWVRYYHTHLRATGAAQSHYYTCPKRFEMP